MRKLLLTAMFLGLVTSPAIAEDINKRLDADPDGHVDISNISGVVEVGGWSRDEVEVTGTLGRNVEELIFERDGDTVTIKVKVPRKSGRGIESDLYIKVPERSSLDIATVSADIDVEDVSGEKDMASVSGDITVEHFGGELDMATVSGDIEVAGDGSEGEVESASVSGDIIFFKIAGTLDVEAVSGDLIVDEGSFSRARMESVNGEILFRAKLQDGGRLAAETVNGDIDVEFDGEVEARFEIETFNGDIDNCFGPDPQKTSKWSPGLELEFSTGDGDGRVSIASVNGDVSICYD